MCDGISINTAMVRLNGVVEINCQLFVEKLYFISHFCGTVFKRNESNNLLTQSRQYLFILLNLFPVQKYAWVI
jgi:hypothetical protein